VTQPTYYRWRKDYGGMSRDQLKRLKELETENARLRRAVSDLTLDKMILTEAARDEGRQRNHPVDGFQPRTRSPSKPFLPPSMYRPCATDSQRIRAQGLPHIGAASLDAAQDTLRFA